MTSFAIKTATVEDIPLIITIQEQTWEPTYRQILSWEQIDYMFALMYSPESLYKQIQELGHTFLILSEQEKYLGFASFSRVEESVFKLHKIYVLPESQGTGSGSYLLEKVEECVRELGAERLTLNVNRFNKARYFYEKKGFRIVQEEDIAIGPYWMNDYLLEKTWV
ncbi:GNAT family N-acetyltransferase [Telluribacter sp.]|jgi:GNAT superfamily N-acetyltransferase|uniref:GNAT family N-acetyltransferase n=1 Tax=Telluribacter sp. TaxID=1978767 RepID=UPI002E12B766|nr:GNAT family N-acetyltransferase [Telluribacter sp.]